MSILPLVMWSTLLGFADALSAKRHDGHANVVRRNGRVGSLGHGTVSDVGPIIAICTPGNY